MSLYSRFPETGITGYGEPGEPATFEDAGRAFAAMVDEMTAEHERQGEDYEDWAYGTIATCELMPVCAGTEPALSADGGTIIETPAGLTDDEAAACGVAIENGVIRFGEDDYPENGTLDSRQAKGYRMALRLTRPGTAIAFDMGVDAAGRHRYDYAGWANLG